MPHTSSDYVTSFTFEPRNLPWTTQDPSGGLHTQTFDGARRLTYELDPKAQMTTYQYDHRGGETLRINSDGTRVSTSYDAVGQITQVIDSTGVHTTMFDGRGLVTLEASPAQPGGVPFTHGYDGNRNRVFLGSSQGLQAFSYDQRDLMSTRVDTGDPGSGVAPGTTSWTYDPRYCVLQQTNPNGTYATHVYDPLYNTLRVHHANASGGLIDYTYCAYDALSRPTSRQTSVGMSTFAYDAVSQLLSELSTLTGLTSWTYDNGYRRTSQQTPTTLTNYTLNLADQITVMTAAGVPTTLAYDANGNTVSVWSPTGTMVYDWDPCNRLASAIRPDGSRFTMSYTADDLRFQRQAPYGSDVLLWSGSDVFNSVLVTGSGSDVTPILPSGPPSGGAVQFVKYDTTTEGSWDPSSPVYGSAGYEVVNDLSSIPSYMSMANVAAGSYTWAATTTDTRGLQKASNPSQRIAACWFGDRDFLINLDFTDGNSHQVALYCLDWDGSSRVQRFDVLDGATGQILDTRSLSSFHGGTWVVYDMLGSLQIRLTKTAGTNAVVSGIFFDTGGAITAAPVLSAISASPSSLVGGLHSQGSVRLNVPATSGTGAISLSSSDGSVTVPSTVTPVVGNTAAWFPITTSTESTSKTVTLTATLGSTSVTTNLTQLPSTSLAGSAAFAGRDFLTAGSWKGTYGGDGYNVLGDASSYPSYATLTETGNTFFQWTTSNPNDARDTVKSTNSADRQASCWYSTSNFTMTLALTGGMHRVGLYCLDWEASGLAQRIDISDSTTGDLLDSQTLSNFQSGAWLFWNISGTVKIKITVTTGSTAVVSAITFDPVPPTSTAPASRVFAQTGSLGRLLGSMPDGTPINLQYHTDAHGNVTALSDAYGNLSTAYYTDAWGNVIAGSSAQNPYVNAGDHGYWQDADLGLNYVRARWLNPETGTWLSVDPIQGEPRYNYAGNSPTVRVDPSGMASQNLTAAQAAKILDRGLDPASVAARMGQLRREMQKMISGAMEKRMSQWEIAAVRSFARTHGPLLTKAEIKLLAEIEYSSAHYVRNIRPYVPKPRKHGPSPEEKKYIDEQADIFNHEAEGAWRRGAFAWETGSYLGDVGAFAKGELLAVPRGLWSAFNTFGDTMLGIYNWPARPELIPHGGEIYRGVKKTIVSRRLSDTLTSSTAWKHRGDEALQFLHGFNFLDQPNLESSGNSFFNDELLAAEIAPRVAPYVQATGRATRLWANETVEAAQLRRAGAAGGIGNMENAFGPAIPGSFHPPVVPTAETIRLLQRPDGTWEAILIGQRRASPMFTVGKEGSPVAGRLLTDVAADLRKGIGITDPAERAALNLRSSDFKIEVFRHEVSPGKYVYVAANTRGLTVHGMAEMYPENVVLIKPSSNVLRRLQETPWAAQAARLPAGYVLVTEVRDPYKFAELVRNGVPLSDIGYTVKLPWGPH